ncbi:hypothetical protein F4803DRAFT_272897 [Xylaria telfairii]|nr:hypothetical protein F4803DRAFT_272897 [Xylaria telfairii]
MAEVGRIAQTAMRSASLLRATAMPSRCPPCRSLALAGSVAARSHMSTTSSLRSSNEPARPTPAPATPSLAKTHQQSYASWADPSHTPRRTSDSISHIRTPGSSLDDMPFGGRQATEQKTDDQESIDFATDVILGIADVTPGKRATAELQPAPRAYLRMVPRTGRTVYVKNNVDVARSFKLLAVQVAQNTLRRDFQQQRFHERPGKQRKRLKSERWRKRFQKGFKATVSRVRELTAQGW